MYPKDSSNGGIGDNSLLGEVGKDWQEVSGLRLKFWFIGIYTNGVFLDGFFWAENLNFSGKGSLGVDGWDCILYKYSTCFFRIFISEFKLSKVIAGEWGTSNCLVKSERLKWGIKEAFKPFCFLEDSSVGSCVAAFICSIRLSASDGNVLLSADLALLLFPMTIIQYIFCVQGLEH